ncbi:MAG: FKBP-type peptidyl-prolyl cis-trans isomerase [Bacteroidota bacterium]|nr:FKBP-type peptidyl-prolyl cis-trans isomerase [Bacteroidota bacterium]MDP4206212.1 FKBP-type peptidyl-prolyl cis-trans isomerase [Bacteroidota bacterium]
MKSIINSVALIAILALTYSCGQKLDIPSKKQKLATKADSVSYAMGVDIGTNVYYSLENFPGKEKINKDLLIIAFAKAIKNQQPQIKAEQTMNLIRSYMISERENEGKANLATSQKFLEENKKKSGVVTTASGLQYEILRAGNGPKPTAADQVKVLYRGTFIDGKEFDKALDPKSAPVFGVNQVVKGWTEALQLMPVGSKWRIVIPADLAYGPAGSGPIKPNSTLIFEVELLDIVKGAAPKTK